MRPKRALVRESSIQGCEYRYFSERDKVVLTYEKKKAEFTQSKSVPVGSPLSASCGNPWRRALPRFERSRTAKNHQHLEIFQTYTQTRCSHANKYMRQTMGKIRLSSFLTNARSACDVFESPSLLSSPSTDSTASTSREMTWRLTFSSKLPSSSEDAGLTVLPLVISNLITRLEIWKTMEWTGNKNRQCVLQGVRSPSALDFSTSRIPFLRFLGEHVVWW